MQPYQQHKPQFAFALPLQDYHRAMVGDNHPPLTQVHEIQGFQAGERSSFPPCIPEVRKFGKFRHEQDHLLLFSSSEGPEHRSGLDALPAPAFNMLVFSPQLSICCTGATSSRQGSCSAASSCCSSPWPSSASSVSWPTWPSPASRPPLASESTNRSYRLCRRRTRAIPSSECFVLVAGGHLSCGGSIPCGNSRFFSCCFYTR